MNCHHGLASWERIYLGEIGRLHCGQSPARANVNQEGEGTLYVTGPEQWDGSKLLQGKWTTDPRRVVPSGCIFITVKGTGVGKTFPGIACAIGRDVYAYEPAEAVDYQFVLRAIQHSVHEVIRDARGDIPGLSRSHIEDHEIGLPPLAEQRRIVAKLDRLSTRSTAARDHLARIPKLAARAKQALLAAAFRGELTGDWRENNRPDKSAEALLDELRVLRRNQWIKAEEDKFRAKGKRPANTKWKARYKAALPIGEEVQPYEVPETWRWAVAEEIVAPGAEIVYGIVQPGPQLDDGIPYVRGLDIVDGVIQTSQLLKTSPEIAEKYSRATLQGGDVLLGIIRATKVAIVPGEIAGANITQGTARFRPSDAIMTAFLVVRS
jgi:type I restriction enzyme S subunit